MDSKIATREHSKIFDMDPAQLPESAQWDLQRGKNSLAITKELKDIITALSLSMKNGRGTSIPSPIKRDLNRLSKTIRESHATIVINPNNFSENRTMSQEKMDDNSTTNIPDDPIPDHELIPIVDNRSTRYSL